MPQLEPKDAIQWLVEGQYLRRLHGIYCSNKGAMRQLPRLFYLQNLSPDDGDTPQTVILPRIIVFHSAMTALSFCETEKVLMPSPEKARIQGYGIRLLTSALDSFTLREYSLHQKKTPKRREHPGCNVCILTLDCGTQFISKHINIRPHLNTCDKIKATRINVSLPDQLQSILSELRDLEELLHFESKTDAGIKLLKDVKTKLIDSTQLTETDQLDAFAKPIAHDMRLLRQPTL